MRHQKTFLSTTFVAVLTSMTACSSVDDEVLDLPQPEVQTNETTQYINVKLRLDDQAITRGSDGGFVVGSDQERYIKTLMLTYYDAEGNYIESQSFNNEDIVTNKGLITEHKTLKLPSYVLAWANIDNAGTLLNGLSMTEAIGKVSNTGYLNSDGNFIMTSSSYMQDGKIVYGTAIDKTNATSTLDSINLVAPTIVYLERMAAKVRINKNDDIEVELPTLNNELVSFRLTGMALNGTNKTSYYVKNIEDYSFDTKQWNMDWNAPTLHRSYWATDPNYIEEKTNFNAYNYFTYREVTKNADLTEYCLENTSGDAEFNIQNATHVLVVGQYKLQGIKRGSNLYLYNGKLMTAKDYKDLVRQKHPFYVQKDDKTYEKIADKTYIIRRNGVIGSKAANVKIQLDLTNKDVVYKYVAGKYMAMTANEANAELSEEFDAIKYGQGKCYYAVPIQHLGKENEVGQFGVVRNHMYQITLTKIDSFGSGIWDPGIDPDPDVPEDDPEDKTPEDDDPGTEDPDMPGPDIPRPEKPEDPEVHPGEPIVPEPISPTKDYYVGLTIKVLKWNEISQNIDL